MALPAGLSFIEPVSNTSAERQSNEIAATDNRKLEQVNLKAGVMALLPCFLSKFR